jgi:putative transposase
MNAHRNEFSIQRMASVLNVSCSGYYAWRRRGEHARAERTSVFDAAVREEFLRRKSRYGVRRIVEALCKRGIDCGRNRVAASMRRQGLVVRHQRRFIATTDSKHSYNVSPNLLKRNFSVDAPDTVWVSDITYLRSAIGWLYLCVFIDLYSRKVVGWTVSTSLRHTTVVRAFKSAAWARRLCAGLIVHSDRGVQYCCDGFRKILRPYGVTQSMSRKGDCWDNAVAESFFATLKKEMPDGHLFASVADAQRYLFEYIELEYNNQRIHSTLGYCTPQEQEDLYWSKKRAAMDVEQAA